MVAKPPQKTLEALRKLLLDLGLDFPGLNFIERDAVYRPTPNARVHEVDRTPVVFDPGLGGSGEVPARCFFNDTLDLGGQATTDGAGRLTWKLSQYVCSSERPAGYVAPVSFVTTALGSSPVFLTARIASVASDVVIDVFSWGANGAPAPNARFAWRCWVPVATIVF
ncbi:hypothetical protein H8N03_23490 [Ramlibacter sp. USB13]|uniref:Uncharacterized protein n=1 Tax=Ramlibacter cellulosilyticus TaxID=2764187 RepID=A0A923SHH8_9BURK|nr:hypothetical protein [Ramlibacter cellulosilyticus]MBC5785922.1 hypothetical protein [Ramlibacter cellulosilyticus]